MCGICRAVTQSHHVLSMTNQSNRVEGGSKDLRYDYSCFVSCLRASACQLIMLWYAEKPPDAAEISAGDERI